MNVFTFFLRDDVRVQLFVLLLPLIVACQE